MSGVRLAREKGLRLRIGDMRAMPLCDGLDILVNPFRQHLRAAVPGWRPGACQSSAALAVRFTLMR